MRRFGIALVAVGLMWWLAGCASSQMVTMTQSSSERMHSLNGVVDLDTRALLDDIDEFWQRERGTRLTRWHER